MKTLKIILVLLFTVILAYGQNNKSSEQKKPDNPSVKDSKAGQIEQQEIKGNQEQNLKISEGASGVKRSIGYNFSTVLSDADPGNGIFRFNDDAVSEITWVYVDNNDLSGDDQSKWYKTWEDTTGATGRGQIVIVESETNADIFNVTGVLVREAGYWKIPVEYVSGKIPADGSSCYYIFNRIKKKEAEKVIDSSIVKIIPDEPVITSVSEEIPRTIEVAQEIQAVSEPVQALPALPALTNTETPEQPVQVPEEIPAALTNTPPEQPVQVPEEIPAIAQTAEIVQDIKEPDKNIAEVPDLSQPPEIVPEIKTPEEPLINQASVDIKVEQPVVMTQTIQEIQPVQGIPVEAQLPQNQTLATQKTEVVQSSPPVNTAPSVQQTEAVSQVSEPAVKQAQSTDPVSSVPQVNTETHKVQETVKPAQNTEIAQRITPSPATRPNRGTVKLPERAQKTEVRERTPIASTRQETQVTQKTDVIQSSPAAPVSQPKPVQTSQNQASAQIAQKAEAVQSTAAAPATQPFQASQTAKFSQSTVAVQSSASPPVTQTSQPNQTSWVTQNTGAVPNYTPPVSRPVQSSQPAQVTTKTETQNSAATFVPQTSQNTQTVVQTPAPLPDYSSIYGNGNSRVRKWYRGIIEVGYGLGVGTYGIDNFRINFINGINIGRKFSVGLGVGYRRYFTENEHFTGRSLLSGKSQIPVFIDLRKTFSDKFVTPYIALGLGNSVSLGSSEAIKGGLLVNPSGGIWFNISDRFAVFAGIAYEMQKMEYSNTSDNEVYLKNTSSASFNIGISF